MGLLDDGETDWKLVAINTNDPLASKMNSIKDVDTYRPGLLAATHEWFRIYKVPAGKPPNTFVFNGEFKDANFALKLIEQTNGFWKNLMRSKEPPLNTYFFLIIAITVGQSFSFILGEGVIRNA